MNQPMRIAFTVDPELPVPPLHYGGVERIADSVVRGLVARGHAVTLFAHRDSSAPASLVAWPGTSSTSNAETVANALKLASHVAFHRPDVIASFSRIAILAPVLAFRVPKVMTYHRAITSRSVRWGHILSRGSLEFTAISRWMIQDVASLGRWSVVPNCIPLESYTPRLGVAADAPFVFLGRIEEIKGPHLAIELARRCGRPLIIAGNVPVEHRGWVAEHVMAHVDGERVRYIGPVDDRQKNDLLGQAAALVMTILWEEPFGLVMAEALACGTPVLGLRRGAVPEVIDDGVTGFVRDTLDELVAAAAGLPLLERSACRRAAEERYSEAVVVDAYEAVYRRAMLGSR